MKLSEYLVNYLEIPRNIWREAERNPRRVAYDAVTFVLLAPLAPLLFLMYAAHSSVAALTVGIVNRQKQVDGDQAAMKAEFNVDGDDDQPKTQTNR